MADGQVTRGNEIVKPNVTKVRRLNDSVISGFAGVIACITIHNAYIIISIQQLLQTAMLYAGATADAFTLYDRLETQLEQHSGMKAMLSQQACDCDVCVPHIS